VARIEALEIFDAAVVPQHDLDAMLRNVAEIPSKLNIKYRIPLVIGHEEDQHWLKDSGLPAAGWLENIRKVGTKLVASVADVPQKIAELINSRAYRTVSPEVYVDFAGLGPALRRVALLGGQLPHIKTLDDVMALFADGAGVRQTAFSEQDAKGGKFEAIRFEEKNSMPEMTAEQINALKRDVAEAVRKETESVITGLQGQVTKFQEANTKLAGELKAATDGATALGARVQVTEQQLTIERSKAKGAQIDAFVEKQIADGRITPAEVDAGLKAQLMALDDATVITFGEGEKAAKKTLLRNALDLIAARAPVVKFGEQGKAGSGSPDGEWKTDVIDQITGEKVPRVKAETLKSYAENTESYRKMGVTLKTLAAGDNFSVNMR